MLFNKCSMGQVDVGLQAILFHKMSIIIERKLSKTWIDI